MYLFGDERQEGCQSLDQRDEHGIESVVCLLLLCCRSLVALAVFRADFRRPEAIPASPDIPVVESVYEFFHLSASVRKIVSVQAARDRLHQLSGLGQNVAVQNMLRGCVVLGLHAVCVGIEAEKAVGVPDGIQQQASHCFHVFFVDAQAAPSHRRRSHEIPAQSIRALRLEDVFRVGVVLEAFGELCAVGGQQHAVPDGVAERRRVEQSGGQHMQSVEPAACLIHILHDEISREVRLEPLSVLKRVVHLGIGHRPRLEPAVQHFGHSSHLRLAAGIVGVGAHELVYSGAVQVGRANAEVCCDLVQAAVDINSREIRIVAAPDRYRRAPEAVAADRPVSGAFQPFAESAVADMAGYPVDLLIELYHAVSDGSHFHIPRVHGPIDDGSVGAPAIGIAVLYGIVPEERP